MGFLLFEGGSEHGERILRDGVSGAFHQFDGWGSFGDGELLGLSHVLRGEERIVRQKRFCHGELWIILSYMMLNSLD